MRQREDDDRSRENGKINNLKFFHDVAFIMQLSIEQFSLRWGYVMKWRLWICWWTRPNLRGRRVASILGRHPGYAPAERWKFEEKLQPHLSPKTTTRSPISCNDFFLAVFGIKVFLIWSNKRRETHYCTAFLLVPPGAICGCTADNFFLCRNAPRFPPKSQKTNQFLFFCCFALLAIQHAS